MSDIKIQPSATGSATVTLTAPATGTARTVTLPDATATIATTTDVAARLPSIVDGGNATAMTIGSDENITISNSNNADTVLTIDSQTANGNIGILKLAGDVAGAGYGAGHQSAKINFFQSAEHICTISSKRSEGDEGELSFQTRDASDAAPVERLIIKKDGRGLSQFTAKAWCAWNQTGTIAIRDSHNVSSMSDYGTGEAKINLTNNMATADSYAVSSMASKASGAPSGSNSTFTTIGESLPVTGPIIGMIYNGSASDRSYASAIIFGD